MGEWVWSWYDGSGEKKMKFGESMLMFISIVCILFWLILIGRVVAPYISINHTTILWVLIVVYAIVLWAVGAIFWMQKVEIQHDGWDDTWTGINISIVMFTLWVILSIMTAKLLGVV
jgi:hypothetical protein